MPTADSIPLHVVLLHGAAHDRSVWKALAQGLEQPGIAVWALDLPGHGTSPGPALASIEDCAHWVLTQLETLGSGRFILAGHSMGALVALEATARVGVPSVDRSAHPPIQLVGLVLLGAAYPMAVSPTLLALALEQPDQAIQKVAQYSHARQAVTARDADQTLMQGEQNQYAAAGHGYLLHHDLSLCNGYAAGLQSAALVHCASTLITGSEDRMTPASSSADLAHALSARRIELATGHNLMAEDPAGVLAAFLDVCALLRSESLKP
jgi:pimeloyl-ACP methyl ester carboxylesterase